MTDLHLPTEPTYGWLTWSQTLTRSDEQGGFTTDTEPTGFRAFGVWEPTSEGFTNQHHNVHAESVTGFTPAVVTETTSLTKAKASSELDAVVAD